MIHAANAARCLRVLLLAVVLVAGGGLLPMGGFQRAAVAGAQDGLEILDDDPVDIDDVDGMDDDEAADEDEVEGQAEDDDESEGEDEGDSEGDGEGDNDSDTPGNGDADAPSLADDASAGADAAETDDAATDGEDTDEWSDDTYVDALDAEAGNDLADDDWAGAYEEDDAATEADDAIPVDDATWGEDVEWDVSEVVAGDLDDEEADSGGDSVSAGGMLVLSKSLRSGRSSAPGGKAPRSGSKPAPSRPGAPRSKDDDEDVPYAYGGRPVSALSVPWQAQIFNPKIQPDPKNPRPTWQRSHYCGGALIAKDWVLTAAHCIDQELVDYGFKVRLGVSDISKGDGITYRIDRIVRHSQYRADNNDPSKPPNMYANDIALIRIAEDGAPKRRDPAKIREIPLNRKPLAGGTPVSATGWGAVGSGDTQAASAAILRVDLRLMDTPVCQQRPTYGPQKIHGKVFCAAHPTRSTCRGDSGGPVVLTNGPPVLVGLVSWGKKKCAGDGRPGVYTRIDQYLAWIDQAMKLPPAKNTLP